MFAFVLTRGLYAFRSALEDPRKGIQGTPQPFDKARNVLAEEKYPDPSSMA